MKLSCSKCEKPLSKTQVKCAKCKQDMLSCSKCVLYFCHCRLCKEMDQDIYPNFRDTVGNLYLLRCFVCMPGTGLENWGPNVAKGLCYGCQWEEQKK